MPTTTTLAFWVRRRRGRQPCIIAGQHSGERLQGGEEWMAALRDRVLLIALKDLETAVQCQPQFAQQALGLRCAALGSIDQRL